MPSHRRSSTPGYGEGPESTRESTPGSTPPAPTLWACGYTHPGRQRSDNEDAFSVFIDQGLFIVADGMGGRAAGDVAARMAIDEIEAFFRRQRAAPRTAWPFRMHRSASLGANLLRVGIKVANQAIRAAAAGNPALFRMGAALAALAIGTTRLVVAHVGDVRVYRLRGEVLARLTRDHSVLEEMKAARPDISPEQIAAIAPGNVITRALGTKEEVEPTVYVNTFASGDLYLLCSDGLWGSVADDAIAAILAGAVHPLPTAEQAPEHQLEQACQALLDAANEAGGPDNVTAVLVRVG